MENTTLKLSLEEIFEDIWRAWIKASHKRQEPFHSPTVATIGSEGAQVRTVILRQVDWPAYTLYFHTDYRSEKVQAIQQDNRVSWLFYDAPRKVQARVQSTATIHYQDEIAALRWQKTALRSRRCYLAPFVPGSLLEEYHPNLPEDVWQDAPDQARSEEGYENFCVIACQVQRIDWLYLRFEGHQRALFTKEGELWHKQWIAP